MHWTGKRLPYISAADEQAAADPIIRLLRELAIFQRKSDTYRHEMVRVLLEFADHHGANPMIRSFGTLIQKFDALYGKYQEVVPRRNVGKQSEGPGDPISLTSKALWCCFPRIVPLYDRYSQNAIFIISRSDQHSPEDGVINNRISHRYTAFADLWLQIYEQAKPVIDNADLRGYRYKVRVFDRILWFIGREDYIRDPGELPPVRTSALQRRT